MLATNWLFNTMKKQYRKVNSFTPNDLLESIRGNNKVDPFMVTDDVFKDWDTLENTFIKKLPAGNTTSNHIFTVDINRNNGNSMFLQQSDGSIVKELKLVKVEYQQAQHDADFWRQEQPTTIPPVGWSTRHQVEGTALQVGSRCATGEEATVALLQGSSSRGADQGRRQSE
jgi:hypothetical protein